MNEDQELVARTLKGEKEAFEMIIRKYQKPLFNYIGRMVGERELALDLSQEIFIKTYSSLPSYKPRYKFQTWLFKIASNYIIDHWRKKKIATFSLDSHKNDKSAHLHFQVPNHEPPPLRKYEMAELREKIEKALERIPSPLRELFVWRHINGLSYEEIAEIKGMPLGSVKNKIFQAKELIRLYVRE